MDAMNTCILSLGLGVNGSGGACGSKWEVRGRLLGY